MRTHRVSARSSSSWPALSLPNSSSGPSTASRTERRGAMHQRSCTRWLLTLVGLLAAATAANGQGNLLRNSDFQDDWLTLLPELKNHHWNYTTEVFNRRDYVPDGWRLSGKWEWLDADRPHGQRRLVLSGGSR